ncbi:DUF2182 domain-containing protein [Halomonas lysinitropha]|uniref:DUF2182 domain-containing protein n=1 Tax=Halomonas lysinitropha TaxID=2607506 RepID=A0A5K1I2K1_9GAMM|nr:DUF2182 domain-containing protein [Halomonas lysinitropha]VVZ95675.1 hypothetical protein HALO32_01754 [Halomonas lysinitropha]
METSSLERLLQHDRRWVLGGLGLVTVLCWGYLIAEAALMARGETLLMPMARGGWSPLEAGLMLLMWGLMMAAMMLPSAAPMILLHATMTRRRRARGEPAAATGSFAAGYLAVWTLFSLVAVLLQSGLQRAALLSPMLALTSQGMAGLVLIGAGLYQCSPVKNACLRHCRSPLDFMLTEWREGSRGAFTMGLRHGAYCVGCCWVLMLLLFVGGVMSLAWIAGLALWVLVEKLAPAGHWLGRALGGVLVAWGGVTLWSALG